MQVNIAVDLLYRFQAPTDVLLQIEAAHQTDQTIISEKLKLPNPGELTRIASDDGVGNRIWFRAEGDVRCRYEAQVDLQRTGIELCTLDATPLSRLPTDATRYLMPSRFCQSDKFQAVAAAEFGGVSGGESVAAIRDWIGEFYQLCAGIERCPDNRTRHIYAARGHLQGFRPCADRAGESLRYSGTVCERLRAWRHAAGFSRRCGSLSRWRVAFG